MHSKPVAQKTDMRHPIPRLRWSAPRSADNTLYICGLLLSDIILGGGEAAGSDLISPSRGKLVRSRWYRDALITRATLWVASGISLTTRFFFFFFPFNKSCKKHPDE